MASWHLSHFKQIAFQLYSSGALYGKVDHGVLVIRYGTDKEAGKKYWKVKNSWGPKWDEDGYFHLDRTSDLARGMTAPVVA